MKSLVTILCFLFLSHSSSAQSPELTPENLQGLWKGYISTSDKKLPYEIVISMDSGKLSGYSYITFDVQGREVVSMKKMKVNLKKKEVVIEDDEMLYNNFMEEAPKNIRQVNTLAITGSSLKTLLTGNFETKAPKTMRRATGIVYLEKKKSKEDTKLLAKIEELNGKNTLSFDLPEKEPMEPTIAAVLITQKAAAPNVTVVTKNKVVEQPASGIVKNNSPEISAQETKSMQQSSTKTSIVVATVPTVSIVPETEILLLPAGYKLFASATAIPAIRYRAMNTLNRVPAHPVAILNKKIGTYAIGQEPVATSSVAKMEVKGTITKPSDVSVSTPVKPKEQPVAPVRLTPANIVVAPDFDLSKRKIETIDELSIEADSLTFTLYDNGEVDGDTVSILLNGKTIVLRQGLTTTAFTKTVYITAETGDSVQLVMYAENLGSIAPNTGLLVLQYDNKRKEIRFSGDLSKNAAITLRRRR